MTESLVAQFGVSDAPYCDPQTAPLEYSVCYMKDAERRPQAILDASSL